MSKILMVKVLVLVALLCVIDFTAASAQPPVSNTDTYIYEVLRNSALTSNKNWDWIMPLGSSGVSTLNASASTSSLAVSSALESGYMLQQISIISLTEVFTVQFTGTAINGDTGANTVTCTFPPGAHNIPITNCSAIVITNNGDSQTDIYAYCMGLRLKVNAP